MADERSDIRIEGNTAIWECNLHGSVQGTYIGTFRFRCFLTPLQQIAAGREHRDLLGANPSLAPDHERFLAFALSQLKQRIISAPPFWGSANPSGVMEGDIPDEEVISAILDAAIGAEAKYKADLKKRKEEAINRAKSIGERMEQQKVDDESVEEKDEDEDLDPK